MNKDRLRQIFANYIENFERINNSEHDENYKWRIAHLFHDLINPESPDFAEKIKEAWNLSANLIDSSNRYCFSALVTCAEKEPEAVKALFKNLFADDYGDLSVRQDKILKFIDDANALTSRLHSDNGVFMNDQRSAMAYLFLFDPDNHYLYKASEARSFASCIEFYDDWGSGAGFKLDIYYRMCDALVEEIKNSKELIETNKSRFYGKNNSKVNDMYPDNNYHILAFDIIYGAPEFRYNFYKGIPFSNITAQARKLHEERVLKAQELFNKLRKAQEDADLLAEAKKYFSDNIVVGLIVHHKMFGEGKIVEINDNNIFVLFSRNNETKKFTLMSSFVGKFLSADISDLSEKVEKYQIIAQREQSIVSSLDRAIKELEPYKEYLD